MLAELRRDCDAALSSGMGPRRGWTRRRGKFTHHELKLRGRRGLSPSASQSNICRGLSTGLIGTPFALYDAGFDVIDFSPLYMEACIMLRWAIVFLLIALVAGALGFFGLEGTAMTFARVLFFLFLVLFVVSLVMGRRGPAV
jgi:uncharacterized membrane protein YtjA (UPF0391 family)